MDGNDVIALHEAVSSAVKQARAGKGATVIEAITYRLGDHTTADDASRYRDSEELQDAWGREPIKRLRNFLYHRGLWDEEKEQELQKEAAELVDKEVKRYLSTPLPEVSDLFDYHYANMPVQLERQKQQAIAKAMNAGGTH